MSSTTIKLGRNASINRNTGSYGAPVWVLVDNVRNCKVPAKKKTDDASIRAQAPYALIAGTMIDFGLNFNMNEDPSDTSWTALQGSFLNFTAIELLVLNGPNSSGSQGWRASFEVTDFSDGQDIDKVQTTDVECKPTISANKPAWFTVP
jgi:hypothetical protein